jgi:hypothetical protein
MDMDVNKVRKSVVIVRVNEGVKGFLNLKLLMFRKKNPWLVM